MVDSLTATTTSLELLDVWGGYKGRKARSRGKAANFAKGLGDNLMRSRGLLAGTEEARPITHPSSLNLHHPCANLFDTCAGNDETIRLIRCIYAILPTTASNPFSSSSHLTRGVTVWYLKPPRCFVAWNVNIFPFGMSAT